MAAEALQQGAEKLGYEIEVETQGSVGAKKYFISPSLYCRSGHRDSCY